MQAASNAKLIVNEPENQFEIHIDGYIAFIEFQQKDKKIWLTHTEVPKPIEGQGIGSELVNKVLHDIKSKHLTLVPSCSFVAAYVNKHEEWSSILSEGYQM